VTTVQIRREASWKSDEPPRVGGDWLVDRCGVGRGHAQRARRRGGERRGPGLYVALADRGGVAVEGPEDRLRTSLADPVEFHQSLAGVLGVHLAEVVGVLDQGASWTRAPQPPSVRRTRLVVPRSETVRIRPSVSRSIART